MKPLVPLVQVILSLPAADFSVYASAVRRLIREMGSRAPDVHGLMAHTLRSRDDRGLVEDYLESINWPIRTKILTLAGTAHMPRRLRLIPARKTPTRGSRK